MGLKLDDQIGLVAHDQSWTLVRAELFIGRDCLEVPDQDAPAIAVTSNDDQTRIVVLKGLTARAGITHGLRP
jgi:hypothetical protein